MQQIIDTHAHICDPVFDEDRSQVLERAGAAGVAAIIAVGENLADARKNIAIAESHSILRPAAGLYPTFLDMDEAAEMHDFIRKMSTRLVAVGEVGLDFWVVKEASAKALQKEIFKSFISLAKELDLPLNVHSRSAGRHAVALLLDCGATRVQMHAFDGKAAAALPALEAGYFFSIPPSVIRSRQKQKLVKKIPLSQMLVETDSPVLGPDPNRRNEPANISTSIRAISELKNISEDEVIAASLDNTHRLYGNMLSFPVEQHLGKI